MSRKIILNGKEATLIGEDYGGFDVVNDSTAGGTIRGREGLMQTAKRLGLENEFSQLNHRRDIDADTGLPTPKTESRVRVYTDKNGRIVKAVEIENDERKERPLTEYKQSFTEEVFDGIAAPYINQSSAMFHANKPADWDIRAFPSATLDAGLSGLTVPVPMSIFEVIDAAEGNTETPSTYSNSASAINAPLRPIAQQQSTGVICVSLSCEFYADQGGLNKLISILETSSGFKEGQNNSNRVNYRGLQWSGMLQHNDAHIIRSFLKGEVVDKVIDISQTKDPAEIDETSSGSGVSRTPLFRMNLVFFKGGPMHRGEWNITIMRMTSR